MYEGIERIRGTFPVKIISYEKKHRMAVTILSQIESSRGYEKKQITFFFFLFDHCALRWHRQCNSVRYIEIGVFSSRIDSTK